MNKLNIPDTERLNCQLMDESDSELLWELDQDEEVMRFINGGKKSTRDDIRDILIPRMMNYRNSEQGWGIWKVLLKSDATYLGWILVRPMHFFSEDRADDNLELGWRFHRKFWGNGYATEAARAIMHAIHEQRGITQFSAIVDQDNSASIGIMKKLGMTFVKRDVFKDPLINTVVDYYSISIFSET